MRTAPAGERCARGTTQWHLALMALVILAFALRAVSLERQSLWYDEGVSAYLTTLPWDALTRWTADDIQPPLYYYLLKLWCAAAGRSEGALRWPSVFFSTLTVPLAAVLGRRLFSRRAGLIAGLLFALSPLYIWYAQEARNYAMLMFLTLLSSTLLYSAWVEKGARPAWGIWLAYALATSAALYTHYFAWFMLLFHGLFVLLVWRMERRPAKALLHPAASWMLVGLSFLPWLPFLLTRYRVDESYWAGTLKVGEALRKIALSFTLGETVLEGIGWRLTAGFLVLTAICVVTLIIAGGNRKHFVLFLVLYLVVPVAGVLALALRSPKFTPRYVMPSSAALWLIFAGGIEAFWRRRLRVSRPLAAVLTLMAGVCLLYPLAGFAYSDRNLYTDPAFTKPDFRGATRYLAAHREDNEAVILVSGHMYPIFDYYLPATERLLLPPDRILSTEHVLNQGIGQTLRTALRGKAGVWVVRWQDEVVDPNGWLDLFLEQAGERLPVEAQFWHVRLEHFRLDPSRPFPTQPPITEHMEVNFAGLVQLVGWDQPAPDTYRLYWQALQPIADDLMVSIRLLDEQGLLWGQEDRRPAAYLYPTMRWKPGELTFGQGTLPAQPGTPPGSYTLEIRVYRAGQGTALDILDAAGSPQGQAAYLGPFRLQDAGRAWNPDALGPFTPLSAPASDCLGLRGQRQLPDTIGVGEPFPVELVWQCIRPCSQSLSAVIQVSSAEDSSRAFIHEAALFERYPTPHWQAGEWLWSRDVLRLPADWPAGHTRVTVQITAEGQPIGPAVSLGEISVTVPERMYSLPADIPLRPADAQIGQLARLLGIRLEPDPPRAGEQVTVTLYWQVLAQTDESYHVFVHLVDTGGRLVGQRDQIPAGGARPTTSWAEGEIVADAYVFEGWPAEAERILIGMYSMGRQGPARLPWYDTAGSPLGDALVIPR